MRDIKSRGKRIDNGKWVYGSLLIDYVTGKFFIHAIGNSVNDSDKVGEEGILNFVAFEVIPETAGQYTGLKDKNGKEIYEGDVVEVTQPMGSTTTNMTTGQTTSARWENKSKNIVEWQDDNNPRWKGVLVWGDGNLKVIGNIHENPELLEVQE